MATRKNKAAKAAAAKAAKADPHADCPPPVWGGMQWECRNHGAQPVTVNRPRQSTPATGRPRPTGTAPTSAVASQAMEIAALKAHVAELATLVADTAKAVIELQHKDDAKN